MGISPRRSISTLRASLSMQITSLPHSAKQVPVTSPTYPVPMTAIFMSKHTFLKRVNPYCNLPSHSQSVLTQQCNSGNSPADEGEAVPGAKENCDAEVSDVWP